MKRLGRAKIVLIILAALVVVGMVPLYLVVSNGVQTAAPTCARCHSKAYATWRASAHHPAAISCRQCHTRHAEAGAFPPEFSADRPELDPLCLDCHQTVLDNQAPLKRKLIKISHRRHLDEGLGCLACHRHTAHAVPGYQTNRPPKQACYRCHALEIDGSVADRSCRMCHYIILTTPSLQS